MSEIKVGDRVKIYGSPMYDEMGDYWCDGEIGIITNINENRKLRDNAIEVKLENNDFTEVFHRKQCWKLVKVKKCENCKNRPGILRDYCLRCNGKGKVKV